MKIKIKFKKIQLIFLFIFFLTEERQSCRGQGNAVRKRLKMKSKLAWLRCPEARLKIYPCKARPPPRRGAIEKERRERRGAKYCTPLGDLSFSTDQYRLIFIRASEQLPHLTTSTSFPHSSLFSFSFYALSSPPPSSFPLFLSSSSLSPPYAKLRPIDHEKWQRSWTAINPCCVTETF